MCVCVLSSALNSGTWTADPINDALLQTTPSHVVAMVETELDGGSADVVLTVNGTDSTDTVIAGASTFGVIDWHKDQTRYFAISKSRPVEQATDKKFKTITSVTSVNGTAGIRAKITLFAVPDQSTFTQVACTADFDFDTKANPAKPIACGLDGSAFQKAGRSEPSSVRLSAKAFDFEDGLAKYDGANVTLMAKCVKEKRVETGRVYAAGLRYKIKPTNPEGDGESMYAAEGVCEDILGIPATGS